MSRLIDGRQGVLRSLTKSIGRTIQVNPSVNCGGLPLTEIAGLVEQLTWSANVRFKLAYSHLPNVQKLDFGLLEEDAGKTLVCSDDSIECPVKLSLSAQGGEGYVLLSFLCIDGVLGSLYTASEVVAKLVALLFDLYQWNSRVYAPNVRDKLNALSRRGKISKLFTKHVSKKMAPRPSTLSIAREIRHAFQHSGFQDVVRCDFPMPRLGNEVRGCFSGKFFPQVQINQDDREVVHFCELAVSECEDFVMQVYDYLTYVLARNTLPLALP